MNGRIYDPLLGRFLSADPHTTLPENLQSYNRYCYVLNNPLKFTDSSGFDPMVTGMMEPYADDQLRQQLGSDKAQRVIDMNTRITSGAARADGQMLVGFTPYVGTPVGVIQDAQTLRSGSGASGFEKVLAGVDLAVIGVTLGAESIHGEINAAKTVAKEVETSVRETAEAANAVAKDAASAAAHDTASAGQTTGSAVQAGLDDTVKSSSSGGTVTRYMSQGEADEAVSKGNIPNYGPDGVQRPTHVTTDAPLDSAKSAAARYSLDTTPTHRATVPQDRVPNLGPAPDGRAKTTGGGSQAATTDLIPVRKDEIKKLNP